MRTSDFDFHLPPEKIAQVPVAQRDRSRLLVLDRATRKTSHRSFCDLEKFLRAGDVLVLNDSKVIPARLRGQNEISGGNFEILLLEEVSRNEWWAMMRPGKRAQPGTRIRLLAPDRQGSSILATVIGLNEEGHRRLQFSVRPSAAGFRPSASAIAPALPAACGQPSSGQSFNILDHLDELGEIPLPPYIHRGSPADLGMDLDRYQTIFASEKGSIAAPTAGLHFTPDLLASIVSQGVEVCRVTLHVGLGTFAPVKADNILDHRMHEERFFVPDGTASAVNAAKSEGRRVVAVGTTALRVLETLGNRHEGKIVPGRGTTRIFIHPPCRFWVVDALLTNFHLPRSTLLMLVSAFSAPGETHGRELILAAYAEAIRENYRFFSYGDAMLIL